MTKEVLLNTALAQARENVSFNLSETAKFIGREAEKLDCSIIFTSILTTFQRNFENNIYNSKSQHSLAMFFKI